MLIKLVSPKTSINFAFLKLSVSCEKMGLLKPTLVNLCDKRNLRKDEKYHKIEHQAFLKGIFNPVYLVQVDRLIDLTIFNGNDMVAKSAVIIEMKYPISKHKLTPSSITLLHYRCGRN